MWVWLDLGLKDGYDTQRFMWEDKRPSPLKASGLVTGASSSFTELLQLGSSQTNPSRRQTDLVTGPPLHRNTSPGLNSLKSLSQT